jgi:anti-sigma factor RsiW
MKLPRVSCRHCVDHLLEYLEGTLPPEEEKAMDQHIAACPPCIDFVEQYRGSSRLCQRAIAGDMPDELASRLEEFLHKKLP